MKTGYIAFVDRWFADDGKQSWESSEFPWIEDAESYADDAVSAGLDAGEKVVVQVWQTDAEGNPAVNLFASGRRTN